MNPAAPESRELPVFVREQLMLAQVRLLELTDAREALATQLALAERTLSEAQTFAHDRARERDQLAGLNTALEAAVAALREELDSLRGTERELRVTLGELQQANAAATQSLAERQQRIDFLDGRLRAVTSSRSWRWTAPFRALRRVFAGRP